MKTKFLIACILLLALCSCSSDPYDENNAITLVKARVPKCTNIVRIDKSNICTYYIAVDSSYILHVFSISSKGEITYLTKKKPNY